MKTSTPTLPAELPECIHHPDDRCVSLPVTPTAAAGDTAAVPCSEGSYLRLSRNLARLAWQAAEPVYPDAEPSRQSALYHRGDPKPVVLRRIEHDYSHDIPTHPLEEGDVPRWYAVKAGHSLTASHHPIDVAITSFVDESQQPDLALVLSDVRRPWRDWHVSARCEVALCFAWCETAVRQAYWMDRKARRKQAA